MSPTEIVLAALIVLGVVAVVGVTALWWRHRALRSRFGPEYEHAAEAHGGPLATDRELRERERRHGKLELKPLDARTRQRYATAWEQVQAQFVDTPGTAIEAAQELVVSLVAARGYPTDDDDDQLAQLSVEHARTLGYYRDAREIYLRHREGVASTEDLRRALVHYRILFADLLGAEPVPGEHTEPEHDAEAGRPEQEPGRSRGGRIRHLARHRD